MISSHNSGRLDVKGMPVGIFRLIISAPFIYAVFVPVVVLDLTISIYQAVCFRLYGLPRIKRSDYVHFYRGKMESLNIVDKFNCHYCSYVNGVITYVAAIAAETEKMWCPIKHISEDTFVEPAHHTGFVSTARREVLEEYYEGFDDDVMRLCSSDE